MDLNEIITILRDAPLPAPIEFRLYYGDLGEPLFYTMEDFPGNYVNVDAETYRLAPRNIRVIDGRLTWLEKPRTVYKLRPNQQDGVPCHPRDVCVVVDRDSAHVKWKRR